jgi:hypothetical protein
VLHCCARRPLGELHEVADGKRMYSNYRMDVIDKVLGPSVAAPMTVQAPVQGRQPGSDKPVNIPDSLVAVQAFIMWEEAGKPQVWRRMSACTWTQTAGMA